MYFKQELISALEKKCFALTYKLGHLQTSADNSEDKWNSYILENHESLRNDFEASGELAWFPLSPFQTWIYSFVKQYSNVSFNSSRAWLLDGDINLDRSIEALDALFRSQAAFRLEISDLGNTVMQRYSKEAKPIITCEDATLSQLSESDITQFVESKRRQKIELNGDAAARFHILKLSDNRCILVFVLHQFIYDANTFDVMVDKFSALMFDKNSSSPSDYESSPHFITHACEQEKILSSQNGIDQTSFWSSIHSNKKLIINLPKILKSELSLASDTSGRLYRNLSQSDYNELKKVAKNARKSFYFLCVASVELYLSLVTGEKEILYYSYVSLRNRAEYVGPAGAFTNILAVRNIIDLELPFTSLFNNVYENKMRALRNKNVGPNQQVMNSSHEESEHHPLQVCFVYINGEGNKMSIPKVSINNLNVLRPVLFDLMIHIREDHNGIEVFFEYRESLYSEKVIKIMIDDYLKLLQGLAINSQMKGADIRIRPINCGI